jgi:hypothetical protein
VATTKLLHGRRGKNTHHKVRDRADRCPPPSD